MGRINVRTKGAEGEREVCKMLNSVVIELRNTMNLEPFAVEDLPFQRNQNQSAVGGSDLTSPFPLEIEVKRQETLSVNSWWKQTVASADRTGGLPILIYRQNHKKWNIMMTGEIPIGGSGKAVSSSTFRLETEVTISKDTFLAWFRQYYYIRLHQLGEL